MKKLLIIYTLCHLSSLGAMDQKQQLMAFIEKETGFIAEKKEGTHSQEYWVYDKHFNTAFACECITWNNSMKTYRGYVTYRPGTQNHLEKYLHDEHFFKFIKNLALERNYPQRFTPEIADQIKKDTAVMRSKKIDNVEKYAAFDFTGRKIIVGIATVLKNKNPHYSLLTYAKKYKFIQLQPNGSQKEYVNFLKEFSNIKNCVPYPPKVKRIKKK